MFLPDDTGGARRRHRSRTAQTMSKSGEDATVSHATGCGRYEVAAFGCVIRFLGSLDPRWLRSRMTAQPVKHFALASSNSTSTPANFGGRTAG